MTWRAISAWPYAPAAAERADGAVDLRRREAEAAQDGARALGSGVRAHGVEARVHVRERRRRRLRRLPRRHSRRRVV